MTKPFPLLKASLAATAVALCLAATHGIKSGPGYITGLVFQWQNGKQVVVWPQKIAEGKLKFPDFVKLSQ